MAEMFLKMTIKDAGSQQQHHIARYEDIFTPQRIGRCFLVEAAAGMGKSTYVHKIARDWAELTEKNKEDHEFLRSKFKLVLLLRQVVLLFLHQPTYFLILD